MTEIEKTQAAPLSAMDEIGRRAKAISSSDIIPKEYQGKPGNCLIAMEMAERMGCTAMQIMQSMHIIHGRPTFSAQWLIATVNASGRFSPLRWRWEEAGGKRVAAVAYATDKSTGEVLDGPRVGLDMAKAEGWSTKAGSKWLTMPDVMMMYRSAAFWARCYCPEVAMGLHTAEEVEDIQRPAPAPSKFALVAEAPPVMLPQVASSEPEAELVDDLEG